MTESIDGTVPFPAAKTKPKTKKQKTAHDSTEWAQYTTNGAKKSVAVTFAVEKESLQNSEDRITRLKKERRELFNFAAENCKGKKEAKQRFKRFVSRSKENVDVDIDSDSDAIEDSQESLFGDILEMDTQIQNEKKYLEHHRSTVDTLLKERERGAATMDS